MVFSGGKSTMNARSITTVLAVAFLAISAPGTAHAYIDPGSGSIVLQMILAATAGGVFYFRAAIAKFVGLFRREGDEKSGD